MRKEEALALIDEHKNALTNPLEMLKWTWLRVTILSIPEHEWRKYAAAAEEVLSR